ncbi:MAG: heme A synthase [Ktedonobacteraceae bacterium]
MNIHRFMRILAIITTISSYVILVMGSIVTNTGSGQGCGNSWPFCHGQILPGTITVAGVIEYSHRITSSVDGLLVLALTIGTWLLYRRDFRAKLFGFMSLFFVILQGALGALTVVYEGTYVKLWLLSVHFGLSLIALASVVLLTIRLYQLHAQRQHTMEETRFDGRRLQYALWGLAVLTYLVIYTGALVEHAGAVAACGSQVVGCGSTYLPNLTSLAGIQVLHRYAASSLWLLVLAVLVVVVRNYNGRRDLVRGAWWAFLLITLQAVSGMITVFTGGQLVAVLLHVTIISSFFSVLCYLCVQVGWPWKRNNNKVQHGVDSKQLELDPVS